MQADSCAAAWTGQPTPGRGRQPQSDLGCKTNIKVSATGGIYSPVLDGSYGHRRVLDRLLLGRRLYLPAAGVAAGVGLLRGLAKQPVLALRSEELGMRHQLAVLGCAALVVGLVPATPAAAAVGGGHSGRPAPMGRPVKLPASTSTCDHPGRDAVRPSSRSYGPQFSGVPTDGHGRRGAVGLAIGRRLGVRAG